MSVCWWFGLFLCYMKIWAFPFIYIQCIVWDYKFQLSFYAATTLTSWHLLVTFCSLHLALKMRFFEHKPFEQKAVVGFGILNGISIGLLNLSLGFNSVGFYQVWFLFWFCFFSRVDSIVVDFEPLLYLYSDDQACNHSLYCAVGDPFSRKEIQVLFSFLSVLWFLWLFVVIYLNILTLSLYTLIS
jgi:hypothetical protein